jgi:hypothetical protein
MNADLTNLAVWNVRIEFSYLDTRSHTTLVITAHWKHSVGKVIAKAEKFLERTRDQYPNAKILSATHQGTIDA